MKFEFLKSDGQKTFWSWTPDQRGDYFRSFADHIASFLNGYLDDNTETGELSDWPDPNMPVTSIEKTICAALQKEDLGWLSQVMRHIINNGTTWEQWTDITEAFYRNPPESKYKPHGLTTWYDWNNLQKTDTYGTSVATSNGTFAIKKL